MKSSKSILFISDIHEGSVFAPCSPKPKTKGSTWNPTPLQKKLYSFWKWVKQDLVQQPYLICINGEPIEGDNYKENGNALWTPDINEQIDDFVELLKIYNPKHITMTRGSGYHVRKGATNFEDTVAKLLGVKPYISVKEVDKYRTWDQNRNSRVIIDDILTFGVNGVIFNVAHHIGYNRAYHNKSQAITAMLASLEFMRGKYWESKNFPDVVARAHVHYFVEVRFARIRAFTQPTFKFSGDRYFTDKGVPEPPSIGAVEVIVESNGHIQVEPHIITNEMYPKYEIQWY